jgi:regulatory protein
VVQRPPKELTREEALDKLRHFCGWQERSIRQVEQKMARLALPESWWPALLETLQEEQFLNETRFSEAFVRGKSRMKGWGPLKIKAALHRETGGTAPWKPDPEHLAAGEEKLRRDLLRKKEQLAPKNLPDLENRLYRFGLSRGFSSETVQKMLKQLD